MSNPQRQLVEGLAGLKPKKLAAMALFAQLEGGTPSVAELIEMQADIEAALVELENIEHNIHEMVRRCLNLKPTASQTTPAGF